MASHGPSQHEQHAAPDRHAGHSVAMFRDRFWFSLLLTIPVVVWSADIQAWLGYTAPTFPGSTAIPAIGGTAVFLYGGIAFLRGAAAEVRARRPGMMTLIAMAISVAFATSVASSLGWFEVEIWWELATLITIMLLGHWLEMRSIAQAQVALDALALEDLLQARRAAPNPVDRTASQVDVYVNAELLELGVSDLKPIDVRRVN